MAKGTHMKSVMVPIIAAWIGIALLLSSCGSGAGQSGDNRGDHERKGLSQAIAIDVDEDDVGEDTMTGYLLQIDTVRREIHLDISNWINRGKTEVEDMMHARTVIYDEHTLFQDEEGSVSPESFKKGQKLAIYPIGENFPGEQTSTGPAFDAQRIVSLTMTKEEKIGRLLAGGDKLHTVVLYDEGTTPPYDAKDFEEHVPVSFGGGIAWVPYISGMAVDYMEELGIEKLPVILVLDRQGVVYETDSMAQLKAWSAEHRPE